MLTSASSTTADAVDGLDIRFWVADPKLIGGHRFWSPHWAQSLVEEGLIPCYVVYDDGTNSDLVNACARSLTKEHHHTIVVSRRLEASVVRDVVAAGAVFFPSDGGEVRLSDAIINNRYSPLRRTIPRSWWLTRRSPDSAGPVCFNGRRARRSASGWVGSRRRIP